MKINKKKIGIETKTLAVKKQGFIFSCNYFPPPPF